MDMKTLISFMTLWVLMLWPVKFAVAFTKPVSVLRDYNGTVAGTPQTGTIGYSERFHFRDPPDFNERDHPIQRNDATNRFGERKGTGSLFLGLIYSVKQ